MTDIIKDVRDSNPRLAAQWSDGLTDKNSDVLTDKNITARSPIAADEF